VRRRSQLVFTAAAGHAV